MEKQEWVAQLVLVTQLVLVAEEEPLMVMQLQAPAQQLLQ